MKTNGEEKLPPDAEDVAKLVERLTSVWKALFNHRPVKRR